MKRKAVLVLFGFLTVVGIFTVPSCSKGASDDTVNTNFVQFSSETVKGSSLSTNDLAGKVVMVNYWGTWCPPCVKEIPHFQEVYETYRDEGFVIVGIALPQAGVGEKKEVLSFMDKNDVTYPIIMEEHAPVDALEKRFGTVRTVPTSYLFDRDGNHVETFLGYTEKQILVENVKPLLDQQ